jgi:hypothetical protein
MKTCDPKGSLITYLFILDWKQISALIKSRSP